MHPPNSSDWSQTDLAAATWMQELARLPPPPASLPSAEALWWQAQALHRLDEQRRLTAKLEIGERIQGASLIAGVLALFGWTLSRAPSLWQLPPLTLAATMCAALVAIAAVLALWGKRSGL